MSNCQNMGCIGYFTVSDCTSQTEPSCRPPPNIASRAGEPLGWALQRSGVEKWKKTSHTSSVVKCGEERIADTWCNEMFEGESFAETWCSGVVGRKARHCRYMVWSIILHSCVTCRQGGGLRVQTGSWLRTGGPAGQEGLPQVTHCGEGMNQWQEHCALCIVHVHVHV